MYFCIIIILPKKGGQGSAVVTETCYGLDDLGIGSRWGEIQGSVPGPHPVSYTMRTALLVTVRRLELGVNHPPPSRGEVRERV